MAKKNPEHFRARFEFNEKATFVGCDCGNYVFRPTFEEALEWLKAHHYSVINRVGRNEIYKEDPYNG